MEKQTRYGKIYSELLESILNGQLKIGDKLPTEQELTERYGVSRITSKKALEMLAHENYVTRVSGRGTFVISNGVQKSRCSGNIIGVIISGFSSGFGSNFIQGVQDRCAAHNGIVAISCPYATQEEETKEIARFLENGIKGLIIMPVHGVNYNPGILANVLDGFPLVLADRYLSGLSVPFVGTKNFSSAATAVNYLFAHGHKNIAFVSSLVRTTALRERLDGYIDAYAQSKFPLNKALIKSELYYTIPGMHVDEVMAEDVGSLIRFFEENLNVTAVLAADFPVALLVNSALEKMGKKVPDDISMICYDRMDDSPMNFTYIRQSQYEMGGAAVDLLYKVISRDDIADSHVLLDYELVEGDTVRSV